MAPEPAWADTVRAAGAQRGSWAAETDVMEGGVAEDGGVDGGAVGGFTVAPDRPTDGWRAEDDVGAAAEAGDADVRTDGARVIATAVGFAADEVVGPMGPSAADLGELQALTEMPTATMPITAAAPRRRIPTGPSGRSPPRGIS